MSLKNSIQRELGITTRVRAGGPGSFNVFLNGKQIYSKKDTGRIPSAPELIQLIRTQAATA